jgi:4-aminobutyrate aminotransferase
VPDVLCTAKSLGSGTPIAATVFPAPMDFGPAAHSNTYGGNLLACAASLATFKVIEGEGLVANAERMGAYLNKRLSELQEKFDAIGDVRGLGLMQAIELVKDRRTKEPASEFRDGVTDFCFRHGLVLLGAGRSAIRFVPPLSTDESVIDEGIDILASALRDAAR